MATCSSCGQAMLTERPHRHPVSDATPDLAAAARAVVEHEALEEIADNSGDPASRRIARAALASGPVPATGNPEGMRHTDPAYDASHAPQPVSRCGICGDVIIDAVARQPKGEREP